MLVAAFEGVTAKWMGSKDPTLVGPLLMLAKSRLGRARNEGFRDFMSKCTASVQNDHEVGCLTRIALFRNTGSPSCS